MAEPPSYEESTAGPRKTTDRKGDRKTPQAWSIREQVGLSRTQHVASIVSQIVDHIRERAEQGLSKTTLILTPSDQGVFSPGVQPHGNLVIDTNQPKMQLEKAFSLVSRRATYRQ